MRTGAIPAQDYEGEQDWQSVLPRPGFCRVKEAFLWSTAKSLFVPWHAFGFVWELRLECGRVHDTYRPRYVPERESKHRSVAHIRAAGDVLPPPAQVKCSCGLNPDYGRCKGCGRKLKNPYYCDGCGRKKDPAK
jgi:predicted RNA-binding Zn-ribbon protein involved in translation (DUF1610 family)